MLAPSVAFLQRCFLPLLERMGAKVELDVEREGLFPAGGGRVVVRIRPARLRPLVLNERGARVAIGAEALVANVPGHVAARELSVVRDCFPVSPEESHIRVLGHDTGPGNVLSLWVQHEAVTELVTTYGERRVSAEAVAERACDALQRYLSSPAVVGEHLADQLLLPLWLAGAGSFTTGPVTEHLRTNAKLIEDISGRGFRISESDGMAKVHLA
jgi:RNA 3'-terminal phosphate cyclase (ATP)